MTRYPLLDTISDPAQLRRLDRRHLPQLADELRAFLVESVARTGGHLSSNLGTVELTIALHHVFDTPHDRLVWDVGHQTYAHKVLTGRRAGMARLRMHGGVSVRCRPLLDLDFGRARHGSGSQDQGRDAQGGGDHRRRSDVGRPGFRGAQQRRRCRCRHARHPQRQRHVDLAGGGCAQPLPGAALFRQQLQRRAQGGGKDPRFFAVAARVRQARRRARQGDADAGHGARCSRRWASTTSGRSTATTWSR